MWIGSRASASVKRATSKLTEEVSNVQIIRSKTMLIFTIKLMRYITISVIKVTIVSVKLIE